MASSYRSSSRRRTPSPPSKRHKSSHRDRSGRSRSRSPDRYRHRSSQRSHSSRHDEHSRRDSGRSSRHRDHVSSSDSRGPSQQQNDSTRKDGTRSKESPSAASKVNEKTSKESSSISEKTDKVAGNGNDADAKLQERRERIERWRREREASKKAEAEKKAEEESKEQLNKVNESESVSKVTLRAADHTEEKIQPTTSTQPMSPSIDMEATEPKLKTDISSLDSTTASATDTTTQKASHDDELPDSAPQNGKSWSLEDEDDDDDNEMDVDLDDETRAAAEKSFKALKKTEESKDDDFVVTKPRMNIQLTKPKATVPAKKMQIGLGPGKTLASRNVKMSIPKPVKSPVVNTEEEKESMAVDTEPDIDPLEAYMQDVEAEADKIKEEDQKRLQELQKANTKRPVLDDEDEQEPEGDEEEEVGSDPEDILAYAAKKAKRKDLAPVDHASVDYELFRKDFYIEPPEMKEMTASEVDTLRLDLDGIKIRGVHCPKPVQKWTHCGLPVGCLEVIRKLKYEKPTSIQAQAIPAIMNGRDVIGVAKTGSGKTLAFLLPMFRHIKDQRAIQMGEGPIAIIMTPTRELATQIHRECKPFLKVLGLRAVCAYGGSPIKDQIGDLKRGCEIIVCTPGRMIDLLCANSGRVTNLRRVTYLVLDEADRMFDMGFEPQVMKIVNNVRPSRQTVLFSATFPRQMEALARKVLKKPLEITVGGRSVVCNDVTQIVEVREESTKFIRLLEILGAFFKEEGEEGDARALIFVDRQDSCDNLFRDLLRRGYLCQSLHGGKDQADRDSTIADFKSGVTHILIATSVAARGLDVKQLKLVINYECPNHMEDYVHRVGRTGRAGNKGVAYTFVTPDQDRYSVDIAKALTMSGQEVPKELQELTEQFQEKVKEGKERLAGSGFGGKGLERLDKDRDLAKMIQKRAYGEADRDSDEDDIELETHVATPAKAEDMALVGPPGRTPTATASPTAHLAAMALRPSSGDEKLTPAELAAKHAAAEVAARLSAMNQKRTAGAAGRASTESSAGYAEEIVINDYPQKARWKVTNKEQISQITDITGAAITTRGTFFPPGKQPGPNDRKLYLFIEGDSQLVVDSAKSEIKRILIEATKNQIESESRQGSSMGRYSVV